STRTLRVMPVVWSGGGMTGLPAASWKSLGERSASVIDPSSWAYLMTSACWAVTDRTTICCWAWAAVGVGRSVPRTWIPWSRTFVLVALIPATVWIDWSVGLTVTTGN